MPPGRPAGPSATAERRPRRGEAAGKPARAERPDDRGPDDRGGRGGAASAGRPRPSGAIPCHVTLRQLQCLVALEETSHFGRAAERCLITQPALSSTIRKLEGAIGLRLFERTSRRLEITPAGARLLAEARRPGRHAAAGAPGRGRP